MVLSATTAKLPATHPEVTLCNVLWAEAISAEGAIGRQRHRVHFRQNVQRLAEWMHDAVWPNVPLAEEVAVYLCSRGRFRAARQEAIPATALGAALSRVRVSAP